MSTVLIGFHILQAVQDVNADLLEAGGSKGLTVTTKLVENCLNLHTTLTTKLGIILVGVTGSGKTTCYKVLHKMQQRQGTACNLHSINPKAITHDVLCGAYNHQLQT